MSSVCVLFYIMGFLYHAKAQCDVTRSDPNGTFSSPDYPFTYQPNLNCEWTFAAPIGMVVEILFDTIDLQDSDNSTCLDSIQIYNGDRVDPDSLISSFCGDGPGWPSRPTRFLSRANLLTVIMETDMHANNKTGFTAQYKQVKPRIEFIAAVAVDINSIIKFDRFSNDAVIVSLPESTRPSALTFDPIESYFYYTDVEQQFIGRVKDDGSHFDILIRDGIDYPLGIAAAYLTGLLYWTDGKRHEVSVSRLDGTLRKTIVHYNSGCQTPRGIVISPDHQFLFWTCTTSIERSKADGSERHSLVVGLDDVRSLTIDLEGEKLYWVNVQGSVGHVEHINVDGSDRDSVYQSSTFATVNAFVVDAFAFFWTHPGYGGICYIQPGETAYGQVSLVSSSPMTEGLYYFNSDQYITARHECAINNGGCMELCFPNGATSTCAEVTPFILGCPIDITMFTRGPRTISWVEPTALARNNGNTSIHLPYESRTRIPGSTFWWGSTIVTYVFSDELRNEARCVFTVILSDISKPPVISNCPDVIEGNNQGPRVIFWQEPTAVSSGHISFNVPYESRSHNPGSTFAWGSTTVTYIFSDLFGNEARCSFDVIISGHISTSVFSASVGVEVFVAGLSIFIIISIISCYGYWQCTRRRAQRNPTVGYTMTTFDNKA